VHFRLTMNTSYTRMHHIFKFITGKKIKTLKLAELMHDPLKPENMTPVSGWVPRSAVYLYLSPAPPHCSSLVACLHSAFSLHQCRLL